MIIGTAGHIDHGKTALVRALTGVDTDRLPEEKRRGITIELGFAPLHLEGAGTVGIVDVPGHEAFVRTMVAGATGIDVALLVVAADEGLMPQTREHLAILSLLGTRAGVVALTKCDLVEGDWLALVRGEVADALAASGLRGAPVVATSVVDGRGLEELRRALGAAVASLPARSVADTFRMPVDRAFSVKGTGTVVTGTIWNGSLGAGEPVVVQPAGRTARVRGVQSHGREVERADAGTRAAVALAGIEAGVAARGSWLAGTLEWPVTTRLRAEVAILEDAGHVVRPREWVRFHLGTADVAARLVVPGGPLGPGERRAVRVVLQDPVLARTGDRFVLRLSSPARTLGGGIVVDPLPPRRRVRPWAFEPDPGRRLARLLSEAGPDGLAMALAGPRLGVPSGELAALLSGSGVITPPNGRLFSPQVLSEIEDRIILAINAFHDRLPLADGMPAAECATAAGVSADLADHVAQTLAREGRIERRGAVLRRPGWAPSLGPEDARLGAAILETLRKAAGEPPDVSGLTAMHHRDPVPILRIMEREGGVVAVEADRFYAAEAVATLVGRLRDGMTPGREYAPAELREVLGLSRKYLIPFLEYCDRMRVTERRTTGRVILPVLTT